jgi:hypothetical protein
MQHIYESTDPSGRDSPAFATGSRPGIYSVLHSFGFYDAFVRYDAEGLDGQTLFATIECEDGATNPGIGRVSWGALVDRSPPDYDAALLYPGMQRGTENAANWAWQSQTDTFKISFGNAFVDIHSDLGRAWVRLGSAAGRDDLLADTEVPNVGGQATLTGLNLTHGTQVFASVRVANLAVPAGVATGMARAVTIDAAKTINPTISQAPTPSRISRTPAISRAVRRSR